MLPLPPPSKEPFELPGPRAGILLLHGFTGTPYEIKPLAIHLNQHGYHVTAPALPGHGPDASNLRGKKSQDWLIAAEASMASLPKDRPKIIIGLSMGGLIGTILAATNPIDGLVLLAPAFVLRPLGRFATFLALGPIGTIGGAIKKLGPGGDVEDEEARKKNPTGDEFPLPSLLQFEHTRREALKHLPHVKCKTLVIFGQRDRTVATHLSQKKLETMNVPVLETHFLPRSRHLLPLDVERDQIGELVLRFCESVL